MIDIHMLWDYALADFTTCTNSAPRLEISSNLPSFASCGGQSSLPAPTATTPVENHSATFTALTPPVGIIGIYGKGPLRAFIYAGPPSEPGKIFITSAHSL